MVGRGRSQAQHAVVLMTVILLKEQVIVDPLKLNLVQNYLIEMKPLSYRLAASRTHLVM